MYRLVLYYLLALLLAAFALAFFHFFIFTPWALLLSVVYIYVVCLVTNKVFAYAFDVPTNVESFYITAFILALIVSPPLIMVNLGPYLFFAGWVSILAIASKFVLAINKKHIFNPVALAVAITAFTIGKSANWWVGTASMMPFVLLGGILVVRKVRRFDLVFNFLVVSLVGITSFSYLRGSEITSTLIRTILDTPVLFFAFVMLTEPFTTPPTVARQSVYGALVGALFPPAIHIASVYSTPELALLVGNVFSYFVSPKSKLTLTLKEKNEVAGGIYNFVFRPDQKPKFIPGQYMEWTISPQGADLRGNRRYFTIASSPTEEDMLLGVRFYPNPSTFKQKLLALSPGNKIMAGQLAGEFTLPKDPNEKLVFVAGGIGITPFRSIIKYLIDTNEHRDIVLFYSSNTEPEVAYKEIFEEARKKLGIKTVYTLTDTTKIPGYWSGKRGFVNKEMIMGEVPDYRDRKFYISGSHSMVTSFRTILKDMGIKKKQIKTDFFPGLV